MKTIAFYIKEPIKINQKFMYNQIIMLDQYHPIVIGPYSDSENILFQFEHFYNLNEIEDFGTFIKEQNIIAIHAHQGKHSLEILPTAIEYDLPLIVHFRGRDSSTQTDKRFRKNVLRYQHLVPSIGGCFAVCHFIAEELKKIGFQESKMHVLYGGIDLNLYPFSQRTLPVDGEIRILSVARLVEKKGFFTLLKAFLQVYQDYPQVTLHIIGKGGEEDRIKLFIDENQLSDRVFLRGPMDSVQIAEELREAHLFCLASEIGKDGDVEGIPNALKEAMASGLPVISSFHGGIPELIEHKKTGYLVPEKNDSALAEGIRYFLDNPSVWEEYTKNARQVIDKKFDMNKQIQEQQRLYGLIEEKYIKKEKEV